ncbi:MAG: pyridoxal 5'-phosphate synthase glutaminase subunit PdxT [Solirubrobacteraceae bacterium]|nr:pyridoxal 5'-phosphate synthase glutaminase subunit PdxT [Solirubrobacteraceae bacterium]
MSVGGPGGGAASVGRPHAPLVGVLAIQGGVDEHVRALERCGAVTRRVRTIAGLDGLDGLVLPGGESTTMTIVMDREGLTDPLRAFLRSGKPVLATCAGLILLDREHLDVVPMTCARNAFGRQTRSFEADLDVDGLDAAFPTVFIRAPQVVEHDPSVAVTARVEGAVVGIRRGPVEGWAFHPELSGDDRIHARFVERVRATLA